MGATLRGARLSLSEQVKRLQANRRKALSMKVYTPGGNLLRAHEAIKALESGRIAESMERGKAGAPLADLMELSLKVDILRGTTPIRAIELSDLGTVMEIKIEGEPQKRRVVFVNGISSHLKVEDFYKRAHAAPEGFDSAFARMVKEDTGIGIKLIGGIAVRTLNGEEIKIDGVVVPEEKISGLEPILERLNAARRSFAASANGELTFVGFHGYFFEVIG